MTAGLFELAALVVLAAALGVAARLMRQPIVLAYLITGVIAGYLGFFNLHDQAAFEIFADLGIMFLLFLVGMEINYASLRLVGKPAVILGITQILATSLVSFGVAHLFGFAPLQGLYLAAAFSFASTIIVVKLLSEKKDLTSLYGKMVIGLLLVQDMVAVILLVILGGAEAGSAGDGVLWMNVALALLKGAALFALMMWLGRKVLPFVFDRVARAPELLFIMSLAWVFLVAAVVSRIGFSIEIAGLLAGLALANSAEHFQIASRIRSLRDFFILIFFVILGSSLAMGHFGGAVVPIAVFSLLVLIINPFIVLLIMSVLGYRSRTGFYTGITIGQVSEFSLVLGAIGVKLGHIPSEIAAIITATAIITIIVSSYFITHADQLFFRIRRFLKKFERRHMKREQRAEQPFEKPFILIGANRVGSSIARHLPPEDTLVIEFDPEVVERLKREGAEHIYGDISDPEVFEQANFNVAKLVISTSPDVQDNLHLLETVNLLSHRPKVIVRAEREADAELLYEAGADYVFLPHMTSGQYLGKTLSVDPDMRILESLRATDLEMMGRG